MQAGEKTGQDGKTDSHDKPQAVRTQEMPEQDPQRPVNVEINHGNRG
jgi:hypothetical protein